MNIQCNECGISVQQKKPNHRFCSDRCRKRWHRQSKGKPALPDFNQFKSPVQVKVSKPAPAPAPAVAVAQTQAIPVIRLPDTIEELMEMRYSIESKKRLPIGASIGGIIGYNLADSFALKIALAAGMGYAGNWIQQNLSDDSQILAAIEQKLQYLSIPPAQRAPIQRAPKPAPAPAPAIAPSGIISAKEYKEAKIPTIGLRGKYLYLIGDPAPGFYMMVTGAPGNGKSTFSIKFADYLQKQHGRVLYLAAEQPKLNLPLQKLLKQFDVEFDIHSDPPIDVDQLSNTIRNYQFVVFDSVNHMHLSATDLKRLKDMHPQISFICIMQSTKAGEFKGNQKYLHDCDIRVNLERPKVYQTKSRYAPPSDMILFDELER